MMASSYLVCFVFMVKVTDKPAKLDLKFIENRSQNAKFPKFVIILPAVPLLINLTLSSKT